ncbi:MAG TPA: SusC/RagA family TonB-linked outer membrane protein [Gemmatimonadaceae bacterium]|nr:SusC/RagA family TonB-linked outer membrane protein [Gemmatimonadaceae bacterium]
MKIRTLLFSLIALLTASVAGAQQRRITGRVAAVDGGGPLASASVTIIGATTGTYTNEQGQFSLLAPQTTITIRVRRIGYQQRSMTVPAGQNDLLITLVKDVLQLEAQVVTGTSTAVSSLNSANAVSVVSAEALTRVSAATLDNALQGKVAGAIITQNSGAPGGGTQVQLRGVSSILGAYSPLYVVDGVIVNNSTINGGLNTITNASRAGGAGNFSSTQDQSVNRIADLNPNDIESIQVLKGPSASSIYGSKGTNGVIIITTKQGNAGRTNVEITQRLGRATLANKLGQRCFGSSTEYADWANATVGQAKAAAAAEYNAATTKCHDYEGEYYNNDDLSYETIGSVRGGTSGGTNYFLSGLVHHDNGLGPTDYYNKQSLRVNVNQAFGSKLTVGVNSELLHTLTQRGISGNDNTGITPGDIFSQTPSFYDLQRQADGSFPVNGSALLPGSNPFQNADIVKTPNNTYRLIGSITSNLSLYATERQTLDARVTGGVDSYASKDNVISPATSFTEQGNFGALAGTLFNSDAAVLNANVNGSLVHRLVLPLFTAQTSAGFRQERRELSTTQLTGKGVIFPTVNNVSKAAQTFPDQTLGLSRDFGYFAQEEFFALQDRLLLTAGVNTERSSSNGDQKKYYTYPKFSASYRVPILPSFISELKTRLAYGKAGNLPTAGRETFLTNLLYEGSTGTRASTVKGTSEIRPELSTETEGGFDATMLSSRIRFSATWYKKQITDLLLTAPKVPSTGFTSQYLNGGQITNRGTELELDVTALQSNSASWISNVTFSKQTGFVDKLPAGVAPFNPGVGSFSPRYGNAWIQEGQSTTVIQSTVGCTGGLPASGTCAAANRILGFGGDANPDFNMGFGNQITFGPFRATGLLEWRKGGDVVNLTNNYFDSADLAADTAASHARLKLYNAAQHPYVENAGFVKLREITLGYELPANLTRTVFAGRAQAVRLELSGRNLKTWTKYTGLDPEVSNFGSQPLGRFQDVTPYPPSRLFFFSLVSTF